MALELKSDFKKTLLKDNEVIKTILSQTFTELQYNQKEKDKLIFVKEIESNVFESFKYNVKCEIKEDVKGLVDLIIEFKYGTKTDDAENNDAENVVTFNPMIICGQVLQDNLRNLHLYITERVSIIENAIKQIDAINNKIYSIGEIYHV